MLLTRSEKENLVSKMTDQLEKSKAILIVNYQGMTVNQINDLKEKLGEQQIGFTVIKNSLFKIALKKANLVVDESLFDQPIAIIWGIDDEVTPSKLVVDFGKSVEKLEIVGGIANGQFINIETVKQLAALPGRDELYAKLVGSLNAPMFRLVNALQGNLRSLVYILDQYKNTR